MIAMRSNLSDNVSCLWEDNVTRDASNTSLDFLAEEEKERDEEAEVELGPEKAPGIKWTNLTCHRTYSRINARKRTTKSEA